nr:DNA polymerase alpha catalytic subunit [Tanacetum cinerariifolium]
KKASELAGKCTDLAISRSRYLREKVTDLHRYKLNHITIPSPCGPEFGVLHRMEDVSFSLIELAKTRLNKNQKEIEPHDIPRLFQNSQTPMKL